MAGKLKPFPNFASDAEAERFVETADLSQYDLMGGALPRDEWFARAEDLYKDARVTLRLPQAVVDATVGQFHACTDVGGVGRSELHFEALKRLLDRSEADYAR